VVYRAISASPNLFSDALSALPGELSARNTTILERFMGADRLHIKTPGGSDLRVLIDSKRHRWISNRGTARPGGTVVLPAGEVATFPASVTGKFVADFAFNVNAVTDRDARLQTHPVSVWVEDGRAVRYECEDPSTTAFIKECLHTHCAYNVGELGFGTNYGVIEPVPLNSHINERRPGVHLGFGQHNQDPGVVAYQCPIHLDLIAKGGEVWVDDDPVPLNLENIVPSPRPHPKDPRDEDVFSPEADDFGMDDCCGILTADGLQCLPPKAGPIQ
jgi:leucyl aminopeptidase (aminopeptidase T)